MCCSGVAVLSTVSLSPSVGPRLPCSGHVLEPWSRHLSDFLLSFCRDTCRTVAVFGTRVLSGHVPDLVSRHVSDVLRVDLLSRHVLADTYHPSFSHPLLLAFFSVGLLYSFQRFFLFSLQLARRLQETRPPESIHLTVIHLNVHRDSG